MQAFGISHSIRTLRIVLPSVKMEPGGFLTLTVSISITMNHKNLVLMYFLSHSRPQTAAYDSSKCLTVSNILVHSFPVDYARGETPRCLLTGEYKTLAVSPLIALSNSAHVIAIACGTDIQFFSGINGHLDATITNVFVDHIMAISFDSLGLQLYVAGDRQVRVFHNVTGYNVGIEVARDKLNDKRTTAATQERLKSQIEEYEKFIAAL